MLLSVTIGSFAYWANSINIKSIKIGTLAPAKISNNINSRINFLINFLIFFAAPVVFYFLIKSMVLIFNSGDLEYFRGAVFGNADADSIIFGPGWIAFLFNAIIMGAIHIGLFIGIFLFVMDGRKKLLTVSSGLMILSAIMTLGRFGIYLILVFLLIAFLLKKTKTSIKIKNSLIVLMFLLTPMVIIGAARGFNNLGDQVKIFAVDYNTLGFSLFDDELNTSDSSLNSKEKFGFSSLGVIENSFFILFRKLGFTERLGAVADVDLNTFRNLSEVEENPKFYNAFGTIVYSMYYDGGILFVIVLSFIFGYLFNKHVRHAFDRLSVKSGSLFFLYLYLGLFGIYQPLLMSFVWLPIIGLNIMFIGLNDVGLDAQECR